MAGSGGAGASIGVVASRQMREGTDNIRSHGAAARAARDAGNFAAAVDHLLAENAELKLYVAALIRAAIHSDLVTHEQFRKLKDAIDASDGLPDGQFEGTICPDGRLQSGPQDISRQQLNALADAVSQISRDVS
jgi:hypothetical protein